MERARANCTVIMSDNLECVWCGGGKENITLLLYVAVKQSGKRPCKLHLEYIFSTPNILLFVEISLAKSLAALEIAIIS